LYTTAVSRNSALSLEGWIPVPTHSWTTTSLTRHFPSTPAQPNRALTLDATRNERVSSQVAFRLEDEDPQWIRVEAETPTGIDARVRRVG
jgi:hypothetical protein